MFGKKGAPEPANYQKIDTLIGKETNLQGTLIAKGTIRIDGEFKGDIQVQGDLVIGETGKVETSVEARNVLIAGHLKGNIQASGLVDLAPSARLYGDIRVKNLIIEEGAIFKGNCLMESKDETTAGMQEERD
ncbi:MAG: polymer-forming cytoskeletal protein [Peptococcaceae bacterium]|jgi:cytoskeletal protein CcmA (bactofilin family)|nr:polymer-forming cytoskeletal protein [Peptococcaceae bacterium]MDH7523807.1 polymer-forming cytoskeletal protein [Peptococcaceae bacterium]